MTYSNIPLAHTVVALCKEHGVHQIVISPGSRNAPLILGFTGDPYFECFSVVDERSAAFFALGLSQQSHKPTVLVCSSGSALLNYYPAVAEAFYSKIPLLVLSADRPPYMVDIGDGQTIRQAGVFGNHIGFQVNLEQDLTHASTKLSRFAGPSFSDLETYPGLQQEIQSRNEARIHEALRTAVEKQLPVHLNVPLEEPLYGTQDQPPVAIGPVALSATDKTDNSLVFPRETWHRAPKKLVLVGSLPPGSISDDVLDVLASDPSVLVFTETTSNLHHSAFFPSIDSIIAPMERSDASNERFEALRPDVLLTFGGMVVSKKIKQFLRQFAPKHHWHVDEHEAYNTYFCLEQHYKTTPQAFFEGVYANATPKTASSHRSTWTDIRLRLEALREEYSQKVPYSDFKVFHRLFRSIPEGTQIQLANSATVRYAQLFPIPASNPVFCNRGTSGIEGSTSTAVGAAWNYAGPTVLISGDLSFLYDANGLWNRALRPDFRVIVVNNTGGGIFRILPGFSENLTFQTYFETVHSHSLESLCRHHGINYHLATAEEELDQQLQTFFTGAAGPALLEVQTPRELNNKILLGYFEYLTW